MKDPRILFIGGAKASWQIRGKQLASAMNAVCTVHPTPETWEAADVIVLVKHAAERWWKEAAAFGKPVVWDVLDVWQQPRDNDKPIEWHIARVQQIAQECKASLLIGATEQMARDIGGVYLPHHSRIGLVPTPPRAKAEVVGYDGSPRYLGSWKPAIEKACEQLGLRFVINPTDLSQVDILVAFRGEEWDGDVCRRWKSGVKLVNAQASGRPIVTQCCSAFDEILPCGRTIDEPRRLVDALAWAMSDLPKKWCHEHGVERSPAFTVESVAARYLKILRSVVRKAA